MAEEQIKYSCRCKCQVERRVSNTDKNPGKVFYVCSKRSEAQRSVPQSEKDSVTDGCSFWKWEDDLKKLVDKRADSKRKSSEDQPESGRPTKRIRVNPPAPQNSQITDLSEKIRKLEELTARIEQEVAGLKTFIQCRCSDEDNEEGDD